MRELRTTVHGNVTKEPTYHRYDDGTDTAVIRLASTSRYFDPEKNEFADRKTEFFTVFARRALARHVQASVHRGDPLIVSGRLGSAEWTKDGVPGFSLTLQADAIGMDLTFGTATFSRAPRRQDVPPVDERTGEILDRGSEDSAPADDADLGSDTAAGSAMGGLPEGGETPGDRDLGARSRKDLVGSGAPF